MPLVKKTLAEQIEQALRKPNDKVNVEEVSDALATAIDTYIKSGTVTGTCPAGGGPLGGGKIT